MNELVTIREMIQDDIDTVHAIEQDSYTSAWTKEVFYNELINNAHAFYAVIAYKGEVVGYAGMWVVYDDAQITTIAIEEAFRGKRLGEQLFRYMLQTAYRLDVARLSLEVRVSNVVAQNMYRKFGLVPGGVRKGYYTDNNEDAIVMWVNIK